jgi:putative peptide maturation system protein
MTPSFEHALADAVPLLKQMPRAREDLSKAQRQLKGFRAAHPDLRADLLIDKPPGSSRVDYDLLLGDDSGTLALSWRTDGGVPWSVTYADHWAASLVVSVNEVGVTVQDALLFLKLAADRQSDLMTALVDSQLIVEAIATDPPTVSRADLQAAADRFRRQHGLLTVEATRRWLAEAGMSVARFEECLTRAVQERALRDRVTADDIQPYFERHRMAFDLITCVQVTTPDESTALAMAQGARGADLTSAARETASAGRGGVDALLRSQYAREWPEAAAAAGVGTMVGPTPSHGGYSVVEVLARRPAELDDETRAAIATVLFQEWLVARRNRASVRWHWL